MTPAGPAQRPALAPQVRLTVDPITGDSVLLFPEGIFILNDTAREIVARCDGTRDAGEIVRELAENFDEREDVLARDMAALLDQLRQRNLLRSPA